MSFEAPHAAPSPCNHPPHPSFLGGWERRHPFTTAKTEQQKVTRGLGEKPQEGEEK